jgi:hypothetical protein
MEVPPSHNSWWPLKAFKKGREKERNNLRLPIRHSVVEMCATPPCPEGVDSKLVEGTGEGSETRWLAKVSVEVEKHIRLSQGRAGNPWAPALG